jgi:hypothetical protein
MKLTKVHLFVMLLLALVFCSFFGGACGAGPGLEGFNMPSDGTTPYNGEGQYSDQYSNYGKLYSANKQYAKGQDAANDRKDKVLPQGSPNAQAEDNDVSASSSSGSYAAYQSHGHGSGHQGIPASQIPPGQEDLYMLKSEIVPPVCPACPAMKCNAGSGGGGEKKCPPCPPCARCPEPAFECKKVPNYSGGNDDVLPHPVLNSFSQFGL